MKIAFLEIEDWECDYLKQKLIGHELIFFKHAIDEFDFAKYSDIDLLSIFIYSKIDASVLDKFLKLKGIFTMSTGYDHIDVAECKKRNISVYYVPSYGENTVAEHAFALLLAISRKLLPSIERMKKGNMNLDGLRGFDIKGKTIGVIGTGKIGVHFIKFSKAFDANIIAYDSYPKFDLQDKLGFKYVSLKELLQQSDIISLHCPLTPETTHLIDKEQILQMKKGVIIINTARGGLISTEAILEGLEKEIISYAGLDVLEEECAIKEEKQLLSRKFACVVDLRTALEEHVLIDNERVLITPHNAFNSNESLIRILDTTIENINNLLNKNETNKVNS
ncbi:Glyoxylate reductase [uncultured archaeon]|nr:Glyoxylate reductase [uncultured archaeon]